MHFRLRSHIHDLFLRAAYLETNVHLPLMMVLMLIFYFISKKKKRVIAKQISWFS